MNFFERQTAARHRTKALTLYYLAAILLVIPLTYTVALGVAVPVRFVRNFFITWFANPKGLAPLPNPGWWDAQLFLWVTGAVLALILTGTLIRLAQVARGGRSLARLLGAVPVALDTEDDKQRRLLHIVEEMAIASGLPQPTVCRLPHQHGINAFTAGLTPNDAVITVTQGSLDMLSRDELQGVIAHEFSHIMHGDTRFKTLMMGGLHGLVYPGAVASHVLTQAANAEPLHAAAAVLALFVFGLITVPLLLTVQIWTAIAGFIKRLVSRQRELLADAAAVQYTRYPDGLAGALKKVGGYAMGGRIVNWHAKEFGHLFFVDGLGRARPDKAGLLSAHPPLSARIRRLDAKFDGAYETVVQRQARQTYYAAAAKSEAAGASFAVEPERIAQSIGTPGGEHLAFAIAIRSMLPPALNRALHHPARARGVLYALLLSGEADVRARQMQHLKNNTERFDETVQALAWLDAMPSGRRLPVASIAIAALKQLTQDEYRVFRDTIDVLIAADQQESLFEYALRQTVRRRLGSVYGEPSRRRPAAHRPEQVKAYGRDVLSCLAYWGTFDLLNQDQAFRIGIEKLIPKRADAYPILAYEDCTVARFGAALDALGSASAAARKQVVEASIACVAADRKTSPKEAECLQAIADALDCPLPPIVPAGTGRP